jgi:hypothetical protein
MASAAKIDKRVTTGEEGDDAIARLLSWTNRVRKGI